MADERVLEETDDSITVCLGVAEWVDAAGHSLFEKDFKAGGEVWRVHKYDPDPLPSNPHAHCVGGARRYVGGKLHLGTAELYHDGKATGRYLPRKHFDQLIELTKRKFPGLTLPLPNK
jgi:hypothetical protein